LLGLGERISTAMTFDGGVDGIGLGGAGVGDEGGLGISIKDYFNQGL
jgi:hypothetical protein